METTRRPPLSPLISTIRLITAGGSSLCLSSIQCRRQTQRSLGGPPFSCSAMERQVVNFMHPEPGTIRSARYTPVRTFRAPLIRALGRARLELGRCNNETLVYQSVTFPTRPGGQHHARVCARLRSLGGGLR